MTIANQARAVQARKETSGSSGAARGRIPEASDRDRKIVHVSTTDLAGGAARAAYRLHDALRTAGEKSSLYVRQKESDDPDVTGFSPQPGAGARLRRLARREWLRRRLFKESARRPPHLEHFRDDRTEFGAEPLHALPEADLYNLHWIADFIDYREFLPEVARRAPIVWTMHDMNVYTGGCHYDLGCGRYTASCGACPQLGSTQNNDLSREIFRRKETVFDALPPERLHVVAGSEWIASTVRSSRLLARFPVSVIHCGVDTSVFRPRDGVAFRRSLDIPDEAFVVLFAADYIDNHRKGLVLLVDALAKLNGGARIHLVTVGAGSPSYDLPAAHTHLGRFTTDEMLALYYSCGDCFIIPSRQEAFGLTALEAMACGTPAIGFAAGGIPDMIDPGRNGLLARPDCPEDLARQIRWMIDHPHERNQMGREARQTAENHFSLERQANLYRKLYDTIFERCRK